MAGFDASEAGSFDDADRGRRHRESKQVRRKDDRPTPRAGHLIELSGEPILLDVVEYRLLLFLSSRPYKAFTSRQIAEAITTESHPVSVDSLDRHVMTLRDKLGLFSDYVQTVPYVGYRFKE